MFLEWNDPALDYLPACPPVRPFRYDPRGPERSLFVQSDAEKAQSIPFRTRYGYDCEQEALVVHLYRNPLLIGKVNEALGYYRNEEKRTVRKIILYLNPETYQNEPFFFHHHGFERNEVYESSNNGNFALVKTLRPKAKKTEANVEAQKGETSTL